MRPVLASLALAALTAAALTLAAPVAAPAKQKRNAEPLYSVSLSGSGSVDQSETKEGSPLPFYCKGESSEALHFSSSAELGAMPTREPLVKYGRFRYFALKAAMKGLTASGTTDLTGHWEDNQAVVPEPCVFVPEHTEVHCRFTPEATSPKGFGFSLLADPKSGRFRLEHGDPIIEDCDGSLPIPSVFEPVDTKLTVGKVLALRKGKILTETAHVTRSAPPVASSRMIAGSAHGTETFDYELRIKRLR
jgi:hypothetical protein